MPGTKNVHKQLGKGINYREIGGEFGVSALTACEEINTRALTKTCSDLCPRLGTVPELVLPLELVPGAQITARAPTKGYVQTGSRGHQSEQCL